MHFRQGREQGILPNSLQYRFGLSFLMVYTPSHFALNLWHAGSQALQSPTAILDELLAQDPFHWDAFDWCSYWKLPYTAIQV